MSPHQSLTHTSLLPPEQAGMLPGTAVSPRERRGALLRSGGIAVVGLLLIALAVIGLRRFMQDAAPPKRQVARIAVLPDTPPPPPPPPKEQKPEPKSEAKPRPTPEQQPKPQPPADAPLKMEGAAGNGPSAFAAGSVTQDYKGGAPTIGGTAGNGGNDAARRAQERLYANSVRQMLRDELERQLGADAGELTATFALWVEASGRVGKWEIEDRDSALEPKRQAALQAALDKSAERLQLPPPQALAQPMRFRLTVRGG